MDKKKVIIAIFQICALIGGAILVWGHSPRLFWGIFLLIISNNLSTQNKQ